MLQTSVHLLMILFIWPQAPGEAARLPEFEYMYDTRALAPSNAGSSDKYAVMIDDGSTGSSLKVFKFHVNANGKVLEAKDIKSLKHGLGKVRPGLSAFADDQSGVEDHLKKLIDGAKAVVPVNQQASTPILLLATAGLRLLTDDQQRKILSETRRVFKDKNVCPFDFEDENAQVITGTKEAIYDWITVNFLKGIFSKRGRKVTTYGTLDLGGASVQVAFNPFNRRNKQVLRIGARTYTVFAKSYLGYGVKEIHDRFVKSLGKSGVKDKDGNFKSPCHHNGFQETFEVDGQKIGVIGVPDTDLCAKLVDNMFFCKDGQKACPFGKQPSLNRFSQRFYAFAAFHVILKRVGALCGPCGDSLVKVRSIGCAAKNFCNKKYEDVKSADPYAKFTCLWSVYIHELFTKGYRVKENYEVRVVKEMNGFELNWILGSMLYKFNLL